MRPVPIEITAPCLDTGEVGEFHFVVYPGDKALRNFVRVLRRMNFGRVRCERLDRGVPAMHPVDALGVVRQGALS